MNRLMNDLDRVRPLDEVAMAAAHRHLDRLTKPPGSLGRLEELAIWLAGVTGSEMASVEPRAIVVAAADHGVARAHPVSAYPSEVTAQMVANFVTGGAAISALAALARAQVVVLDVGVATPIPGIVVGDDARGAGARGGQAMLVSRPVRAGTADMTIGRAMTDEEARQAIEAGMDVARGLIDSGVRLIGIGEMGIGNTTAASAIVAALLRVDPSGVTGRGTGIDDEAWLQKVAIVERALAVNSPGAHDPLGMLASVGGLEIAALVGVIAEAAAASVPVVLDGFITAAAALAACSIQPGLRARLLAAHRSVEPGHAVVLDHLGLRPLLELDLRLGEGTGAALAMLLIEAATRVRDEMATFDSAGVAEATRELAGASGQH